MDRKPIIALAAILVLFSFTSCLVPGAPHHFGFRSMDDPKDSIDLVSTSYSIEYRLLPARKNVDSAFVLVVGSNEFKKMQVDKYFGNYYYLSREKGRDVKRIEKADSISLRIFKGNAVHNQTFKVVAKNRLRF